MKLEQQVISLELAQKLKELGVKQKSLFYFYGEEIERGKRLYAGGGLVGRPKPQEPVSAFTVAELGEMLPAHYFTTRSSEIENHWHCNSIENFFADDFKKGIIADTEADCRAKMLIHLIENNLITL